MEPRRWMSAALGTIVLVLASASPGAAQNCLITAPATVAVNESFTLCGPTASGYTFEWYGPGLASSSTVRCIKTTGFANGGYEFLLVRSRNGVEVDRCVKVVNVGGSTGGTASCQVSGPNSITEGSSATLCAPNDGIHEYTWTGPNGFTATTACVTVSSEGTFMLTSRNRITGSSRQCTHRLDVVGSNAGDIGTQCDIIGPDVLPTGGTARLCATSRSNTSYRWSGPGGYTASSRCITVSTAGSYTVTLRNLSTGSTDRCTYPLANDNWSGPDGEDPDAAYWDNCPRDLQFWRGAMSQKSATVSGLSTAELQSVAREVGRRSTYFNWSNDVQGLRAALSPAAPLTRRKQIARQYAALLANVSAGELSLGNQGDNAIGLDSDTQIDFKGAGTIGELIALTDRWLRENRGNYAQLNAALNQINRGRGIGPVCNADGQ